jgi:hypothetical protein
MGTIQLSPPTAPFQRIKNPGESITINTAGKILVIPTGDALKLPSFNEYTLNSNRLTIAESPFGGLKGAGSPDYAVGTIFTATDGVYITDTAGNNSTKNLTAGKLKELNLLTVNTTTKTITEEFVISNTNTANGTPVTIDALLDTTGWTKAYTNDGAISSNGSSITFTETADAGYRTGIQKTFNVDVGTNKFICFKATCDSNARLQLLVWGTTGLVGWYGDTRFSLTAGVEQTFVLPLYAPAGTAGQNPTSNNITGTTITKIIIGCANVSGLRTVTIKPITVDTVKAAYVEVLVPDYLADSSLTLQAWDSSAYQTCRVCRLDSVFSDVSTTPENAKLADGTKLDDVYGSTLGRAVFPKGIAGATVTGNNSLTTTYSGNKGTRYRIGLMAMLPPSDGGRTNFNKIRLKLIITYSDPSGLIIPDLSGSNKNGTLNFCRKGSNYLNLGSDFGWISTGLQTGNIGQHFTVKYIFKVNSVTAAEACLFYPEAAIVNRFLHLYINLTDLRCRTTDGNNEDSHSIGTIQAGTDYTLELEYNQGSCTATLNGVSVSWTPAVSIPATSNTDPIRIGGNSSYADTKFDGNIYYAKFKNLDSNIGFEYLLSFQNIGATSYDFEDSLNTSYGLQHMSRPWIALYDPAKGLIDYYLFTHRPKNLIRQRNDSGEIYELVLYPGNGAIYHGQITYANLTADADSNLIPNCLEPAREGSITKFLNPYTFWDDTGIISFTTTGATFAPFIEVAAGGRILWTYDDGATATVPTPSKNFGGAGTHVTSLKVTPWSALTKINVGYDGADSGPTIINNRAQQNVSKLTGLQYATGLIILACSYNPITEVDLSGLSNLQYFECFGTLSLASVILKDNVGMKRICVESDSVTELNFAEAPHLEDIRGSLQAGARITINWGSCGAALWHFCMRDEVHVNPIPLISSRLCKNSISGLLELTLHFPLVLRP